MTNRGEATAQEVTITAAARQAGLRAMDIRIDDTAGACVPARGFGVCFLRRLAPGASTTVNVSARARGLLAPVRLTAVAQSETPERLVRNNLGRARVQVVRESARECPPTGPVAAHATGRLC